MTRMVAMQRRNLDLSGQCRPNMLIRAPAYALDECSAAWAGRLDHSRRFLLVPWLFSSVVYPSYTGTLEVVDVGPAV